jgi:DNA-binding transcriptional regulator LsrR (DeoR family)
LNTVVLATGAVKLPILLAAVRGGLFKTLLTDAHLGELLLQALSDNGRPKAPRKPRRR